MVKKNWCFDYLPGFQQALRDDNIPSLLVHEKKICKKRENI